MQATIAQTLVTPVPAKAKSSLFPVLVVLFIISYGLLTLLVVEQDHTIRSQRVIIAQLYGDSVQLSALRGREIQRQHAENQPHARTHGPVAQVPPAPQAPHVGMQNDSTHTRQRIWLKPHGVEEPTDAHRALNRS